MRSVKQGDWKLIQFESADGTSKHTQLFNLAENPDELLPGHGRPNLADNPKHAKKLGEMKKLPQSEMRRLDDLWRFADQPNDKLPVPPTPVKKAKKTKKQ